MTSAPTTYDKKQHQSPKEHADTLRQDAKNLTDDARHAAEDAVHAIGETAKHSAEAVTDITKSGADKAGEYHDAVCQTVRKHPTASIVTAMAAGVILGKLLGR